MNTRRLLVVALPLTIVVSAGLLWYARSLSFAPPRPLFSNTYAVPEKGGLFARWIEELPLRDDAGLLLWSDFHENMLLLMDCDNSKGSWQNDLLNSAGASVVVFGCTDPEKRVPVKAATNTLVVVLPNGSIHRFAIKPGVAQRVIEEGTLHRDSLASTAAACLDRDESGRFDSLLPLLRNESID